MFWGNKAFPLVPRGTGETREFPVKNDGELPGEWGMKMGNNRGIPRFLENKGIPRKNRVPRERGICNEGANHTIY